MCIENLLNKGLVDEFLLNMLFLLSCEACPETHTDHQRRKHAKVSIAALDGDQLSNVLLDYWAIEVY